MPVSHEVIAKSNLTYNATLPFTFKRTLVADTDQSIDIPAGTKTVSIYHALATPVFAMLDGAVTVPAAGAAGQHAIMFPPNMYWYSVLFEVPTTLSTYDLHIRSASPGDVWVMFNSEVG